MPKKPPQKKPKRKNRSGREIDYSNVGRQKMWDKLGMPGKLELVRGWARSGALDQEIFEALGVSKSVFYRWKVDYPEFADALAKGKEFIDIQVESALLKRALGFQYDEVTREPAVKYDHHGRIMRDDDGQPIYEMAETKRVTKEVNPDTTAAIFWLKNRRPDAWRDKQQVDVSGIGPVMFVNDLPPDVEEVKSHETVSDEE